MRMTMVQISLVPLSDLHWIWELVYFIIIIIFILLFGFIVFNKFIAPPRSADAPDPLVEKAAEASKIDLANIGKGTQVHHFYLRYK